MPTASQPVKAECPVACLRIPAQVPCLHDAADNTRRSAAPESYTARTLRAAADLLQAAHVPAPVRTRTRAMPNSGKLDSLFTACGPAPAPRRACSMPRDARACPRRALRTRFPRDRLFLYKQAVCVYKSSFINYITIP